MRIVKSNQQRITQGFIALALLFVSVAGSPTRSLKDTLQTQLRFIGAVEGKSYYLDSTTLRPWEVARSHCQMFNMQLASMETRGQTNFVIAKFRELELVNSADAVWTAGRYYPPPSDFYWDNGVNAIVRLNSDALGSWPGLNNIQDCIRLEVMSTTHWYVVQPCTDRFNVLCETRA